ncbi:MAG: MarR family transcriptional regulator [Paracoccaceae bacterium]|nr:MarR family transcriptional regulator [Paracoccaceae bacterium]MDG1369626.1 MarR family transcriptional regulator [Paracoccaceae bacterium]
MAKDGHAGVDVAEFIATVGLRHAYRLSYLTNAIVTAGYDAVKRETGLIRGEYLLLLCLSHQKILTAQDVARMTRRPRNTISRAVHRMLDEGYIDRAPDPSDGRQSKLTITAKGRAMQTRIEQILSEREEEVVAPLSADDHASLDAILQKLVRHAASLKD